MLYIWIPASVISHFPSLPFSVWFRQTGGVFRSLREILRWSGFRVVGTFGKGGCRKHGELTPREIGKCEKLAKRIC